MATLTLDKLSLVFPDGIRAVRDIDLAVEDGEFCVFLGPSGCGKTSALRMIAGLEVPTSGEIRLDGEPITDRYAGERDIAMVFQHFALYPNRTVREHFEFPLKAWKVDRPERERRVSEIAELLHMTNLLDAKPRQLSGGQAQRTAIGRALIRRPKLFLLDEPLTSLDAPLRLELRAILKRLQAELGITMIYVTHDQAEALSMADRIVVMKEGRIQQVASPAEIYQQPRNLFVAGFVGTPAMNLIGGAVNAGRVIAGGFSLPIGDAPVVDGESVVAGVRPEDLEIGHASSSTRGRVMVVEPQGDERIVSISLADTPEPVVWKARASGPKGSGEYEPGQKVTLTVRHGGLHLFNGTTASRIV